MSANSKLTFLRSCSPDFTTRFGKLHELGVGIRTGDRRSTSDISLDCQITIQTPVRGEPAVDRGPHVKVRDKVLVGFLFLRPDDDRVLGGDLDLYRIRPGLDPVYGAMQVIDPLSIQLAKTIPYRKNTLVMFLNFPLSIRGTSFQCANHNTSQDNICTELALLRLFGFCFIGFRFRSDEFARVNLRPATS